MKCDKCGGPLLKHKNSNDHLRIKIQDYKDSTNNGTVYLCKSCRSLFLEFTGLEKPPPHPMQPLVWGQDTIRFKGNFIVRYLLDHGGFDLNFIAMQDFSREDNEQFAQLIGYSVSGFSELSYASDEMVEKADTQVEQMIEDRDGGN